jgi:hypothetical protein
VSRRGAAIARRARIVVAAAMVVATARGTGAQDTATVVDPEERWCAPPGARAARPDTGDGGTLCLRPSERLRLLARQAIDPLFYGEVLLSSGWGQWRGDPAPWGRDWDGFGRRAVAATGAWAAYAASEAVVAGLLDVDPRPTFAHLAAGRPALRTALVNATTLRRRDGTRVVALPRLAGSVAGGWAFGRLRPEGPNAGRIAADVAASFAFATATHVVYEYWRWWRRPRTVSARAGRPAGE